MTHQGFARVEDSHAHSLQTLNMLYEHDDFMASIGTLADMGCGSGLDLEWWATRTTRDDVPQPLNIKCTGFDRSPTLDIAQKIKNIQYQSQDFEQPILTHKKFDVIWCHDAFQYAINPFQTLKHWHDAINDNGMLILSLPQTTNLEFNTEAFNQPDFHYYNWTTISLIHVLSASGWDCASGFFKKSPNDIWLNAIVYKSNIAPVDPRTARWYNLAELGLLPESAVNSINKYGFPRQQDLVLPWLDGSLAWLGQL